MSATFPWCSTARKNLRERRRDERGLVFPSPVVVLSIIAVAMAAVAFLATRGSDPADDRVEVTSQVAAAPTTPAATTPAAPVATEPAKKKKPAIKRSKIYVEVYNNSGKIGRANV